MTSPASLSAEWWSEAQARDAMVAVAIEAAQGWADGAFLHVEGALTLLAFDACGELRAWIERLAAGVALDLAEDSERLAAELGLTKRQRRRFIADRVGAFRARLAMLVATVPHRGEA